MKRAILVVGLFLLLGALVGVSEGHAQGSGYTVQAGDTLFGIARRYGINVNELAAVNGLTLNSWLYVGQVLTIPGQGAPASAPTAGYYVVQPGDTLSLIALRVGVTTAELAQLNGLSWNAWVYTGQRLLLPGGTPAVTPPTPAPATGAVYVVQPGDTLFSIARRNGTTVAALQAANGLLNPNQIYVGQSLKLTGTAPPALPVAAPAPAVSGKWIDVNLSTQTLVAYEGSTPVFTARVSTGLPATPTVVGTFQIYVKYLSTVMSGPGYYLPNVPYTMYFYRGYGLHGTYWHNNFGTPMSHGCVNLATPDAEWLYNWAPIGTTVVTHY